jgi:hypothetical protein
MERCVLAKVFVASLVVLGYIVCIVLAVAALAAAVGIFLRVSSG